MGIESWYEEESFVSLGRYRGHVACEMEDHDYMF